MEEQQVNGDIRPEEVFTNLKQILPQSALVESRLIWFADVIRTTRDPAIQSTAFSFLLQECQTNQHHINKFLDELNGLKLVEFILAHPDCIVTIPMLTSYLSFCLVKKEEQTIIKGPKLLQHLLGCWKAWHKDVRVAELLYTKLSQLVQSTDSILRPNTHYTRYNFRVFNEAKGIKIMFKILRDCLIPIDETVPRISRNLVKLIINLITLLIKHPPSLNVMQDIINFLIFLHPDPKAYVVATPANNSFLHVVHTIDDKSSFETSIENLRSFSDDESSAYGEENQDEDEEAVVEDEENCSNRNYAIANITDMLASIIKLTSLDATEILSKAFQERIIDARKLIILANNESPLVREKALRLFLNCLKSIYSMNLEMILTVYEQNSKYSSIKICKPIQLMGIQLLKYPTTVRLIQLCYGIIVDIDDFETVETVCSLFEIGAINNNFRLNIFVLLSKLMTKLEGPGEMISAVKFVYAYVKQLLQLGKHDVLCFLLENDLVDSLMRIYFSYVKHKVNVFRTCSHLYDEMDVDLDEFGDEFDQVARKLDKTLVLITCHLIENLSTEESIKSIETLLVQFDLLNTYVPKSFQSILRDRKAKILTTLISYCNHYEICARQRSCAGKVEYYLKSIFTTNNLYLFPNVLSANSQINMSQILEAKLTNSIEINQTSNQEINSSKGESMCNLANEDKKISETDVIERFKATIQLLIDHIIAREPGVIPSQLERRLVTSYMKLLSRHLTSYRQLTTGKYKSRSHWYLMLPKLEKLIRASFSQLILYLLSPCDSMNLDERKFYAQEILNMFSIEELIHMLDGEQAKTTYHVLVVFIKDLIDFNSSEDDEFKQVLSEESLNDDHDDDDDDSVETSLKQLVKNIELKLGFRDNKKGELSDHRSLELYTKFRNIWLSNLSQAREDAQECLNAEKDANYSLTNNSTEDSERTFEEANQITRDVVDDKHEQRKIYLQDLKQNKIQDYHIRQRWLSLIIGHTHERGNFFLKNHYPNSWELNPVEGPSRIRRRLRPCKLALAQRYLRQPRQGFSTLNEQSRSTEGREETLDSSVDESLNRLTSKTSEPPPVDDWYNHYSPHPLCSMVLNHEQFKDPNELRIRMFTTDKIHFNCDCSIIRPNEVCDGEVSIASWCIHFIGRQINNDCENMTYNRLQKPQPLVNNVAVYDSGYEGRVNSNSTTTEPLITAATDKETERGFKRHNLRPVVVEDLWFDEIVEVWNRRYQLQDVGLEIFLTNNMTYLIKFRSNRDREEFKQSLKREQHKMINLQKFNLNTTLNRLTQFWREGRITNFDYLTNLNKLAGRSFNDLMQYPVFPFILSNYKSQILNLMDPNNFRNLKKPMAIQKKEKEVIFINNYEDSKSTNLSAKLFGQTKPYHYGNHYSNSATVLHFLVRVPPFTQMLIQYQDNNFDQPDRTFHSIASTWQLITKDSNTDFKELIPEFFFLPEMFINFEQFNFGQKQNNELVDDVKLPDWCPYSDARLFTLIHRQALESPHVSENLHHWVDLIFGYKQTGKAAVDAINVFHPATYYGEIDLRSCQEASLSQFIQFGSTTVNSTSAKLSSYGSASTTDTNSAQSIMANTGTTTSKRTLTKQNKYQPSDIERLALETMIKTYGQMPRQLYLHPVKQRIFATCPGQQLSYNVSVGQQHSENERHASKRRKHWQSSLLMRQIKGLRWGSYVGSPDEDSIIVVELKSIIDEESEQLSKIKKYFGSKTKNKPTVRYILCLMPNGEIAILRSNSSLMLDHKVDIETSDNQSNVSTKHSRRAGLSSVAKMNLFSNMIISRQQYSFNEPAQPSINLFDPANPSSLSLAALSSSRIKFSYDSLTFLSWSCSEGIIEMKHPAINNQAPAVLLVNANSTLDTMSTCSSAPELNLLLVGYKSGSICAHIVSTSQQVVSDTQQVHTISPGASRATLSSSSAASAELILHTTTTTTTTASNLTSSSDVAQTSTTARTDEAQSTEVSSTKVKAVERTTKWLYCHTNKINCIKINVSFGVVVTGSDDGSSVIWDLNSLTYIRTIDYKIKPNSKKPPNPQFKEWHLCDCQRQEQHYIPDNPFCICSSGITMIAVSDTLGDIVTIKDISDRRAAASELEETDFSSESNLSATSTSTKRSEINVSSIIYAHTINGSLIHSVETNKRATAVCYSNAPEGVSINVIVAGFTDGLISLYSSWDLSLVHKFYVDDFDLPITSLLYSRDNQLLYVVYENAQLLVMQNKKKTSVSLPKQWFLR